MHFAKDLLPICILSVTGSLLFYLADIGFAWAVHRLLLALSESAANLAPAALYTSIFALTTQALFVSGTLGTLKSFANSQVPAYQAYLRKKEN